MDFDPARVDIEGLLKSFLTEALGLSLEARIPRIGDLPEDHRIPLTDPQRRSLGWAAWQTNRGPVSAHGAYDYEQALRKKVHVLLIEWWIANQEHHQGWWHCYQKRPREWIKGSGT
jgi:hypothetical protein